MSSSRNKESRFSPQEIAQLLQALNPTNKDKMGFRTIALRIPQRVSTPDGVNLRFCAPCSDRFGGYVYHRSCMKCWYDERSIVNEGSKRFVKPFRKTRRSGRAT